MADINTAADTACGCPSIWLDLARGLPAAFVALVIGGIAAYIAWRQYETAQAKLKLDLFEKRYTLFEATWEFLSNQRTTEVGSESNMLVSFNNVIPKARFLFGSDIEAYLRDASSKHIELRTIASKTKANGGIMVPEDIERNTELLRWFGTEASEGAKARFNPYLGFEKWK